MTPPEVAFQRFLNERHARGEKKYAHIIGRIAVEDLNPDHLYRWFSDWMNHQLSDVGVKSTGGVALPLLRFELATVRNDEAAAHIFETEEYGFVVLTQPMFDEMLELSRRVVNNAWAFMTLQIAPLAKPEEIAQLLLLMQFSFVNAHEYSHLVRQHLAAQPPHAVVLGESLSQAQEFDADGYAIYHELTYLFHGGGKQLAAGLLRISSDKALEAALTSLFLISTMLQFCARWAGKIQIESDLSAEHPPVPMRIQRAIQIAEMWFREVGRKSTSWLAEDILKQHFDIAAAIFPSGMKASWGPQIAWLKSTESEEYREQLRRGAEQLRTENRE